MLAGAITAFVLVARNGNGNAPASESTSTTSSEDPPRAPIAATGTLLASEQECEAANGVWSTLISAPGCRVPDYNAPAKRSWGLGNTESEYECVLKHNLVWSEGACYYPRRTSTFPPIESAVSAAASDRSEWSCEDYSRNTLNLYWLMFYYGRDGSYEEWWETGNGGYGVIVKLREEATQRECPLRIIVDTSTECGERLAQALGEWVEPGERTPPVSTPFYYDDSATESIKWSLHEWSWQQKRGFWRERCNPPGHNNLTYDAPTGPLEHSCGLYRSSLAQGLGDGTPWEIMPPPDAYPPSEEWHELWRERWRAFQNSPLVMAHEYERKWEIYKLKWEREQEAELVEFPLTFEEFLRKKRREEQEPGAKLDKFPPDGEWEFLRWCPPYYTPATG